MPMNGQVRCEGPLGKTGTRPPKVETEKFKGGEVDPASSRLTCCIECGSDVVVADERMALYFSQV